MTRYLITGVSSGIGRSLVKELIKRREIVYGIARRGKLLEDLKRELDNSSSFDFFIADQGKDGDWKKIISKLKQKKFIPQIIIFNAAISENDLERQINLIALEKMLNVNFLGIIRGVNYLLPYVSRNTQFIAISSFSALKGSGIEGVGYASSKAALSIAFESLYQRYQKKGITFKTIFFGPINSGMGPFNKKTPFILSEKKAVELIISSIKSKNGQFYYPKTIFLIFKLIKLLPSSIYFRILSRMESFHRKFQE